MASFRQTSTSVAKRRRILFECLMCFGLPVVYAALRTCMLHVPLIMFIDIPLTDLIVQPRRFDVYANFGCRPTVYPTVVTLFLVWIPPLALSLLTLIFCGKSVGYCVHCYEAELLQALLGVTFSFVASNFQGRAHLRRLLLEPTFGS